MIDLKRITIPVFLIYAGIIHAIGLALLLPMIVTLPGPGSLIAPKDTPIAVELDAAAANRDVTSALSAPPKLLEKDAAIGPAPDAAADAPGNIANLLPPSTEAEPEAAARRSEACRGRAEAQGESGINRCQARQVGEEAGGTAQRQAQRAPLGQEGHQDRPVRRGHERAVHARRAIQAEISGKGSRRRCCAAR